MSIADLVLELTDPAIDLSDGKRRATAVATLRYRPPDGGRDVVSRRFPFTAQLGPIESDELSWYLERYIHWPSHHFQERARGIEQKLPEWGRQLYDGLTGQVAREAFEGWRAVRNGVERRFTVLVDHELVAGSDEKKQEEANEAAALLLALPWELAHDGKGYLFLGANPVRVRRSLPNRERQEPLATGAPLRVLIVSPRPEDKSAGYIDHRVSAKPVVEALSQLGDLAEFKILTPPTFPELQKELQRAKPYHVVHFDGHGVFSHQHGLGALCFENPEDTAKLNRRSEIITADKIAEVIRGHRVPLFFLDACQTAKTEEDPTASVAGKLLQSGVASVVAMSHTVLVETTRRFVTEFYPELVKGQRIGAAMLAGQSVLKGSTFRGKAFTGELHLQDWFVPVLFQEEQDPQLILKVPPAKVSTETDRERKLTLGDLPAAPEHTFVGRSRELLKAERVLDRHRDVVLRGEGGEGKTTLGAELARWLVATRRFRRAAFVSLEKYGDARNLLYSIGQQLVLNFLSEAAAYEKRAWQLVERALTEQRTVIVLDNMESVLRPPVGSPMEAAFEPEVLDKILALAKQLTEVGETRLVFTSREPMPEPFDSREVRIGRRERGEAIELVGRVLGEDNLMPHSADAGESEEEIEKLVDGVNRHARSLVPLAREVVASGVRNATGKLSELMAALHKRHPDDRERSLFASVELSLRRLPAATRERIRPLGPFRGGGGLAAIAKVLGLEVERNEDLALAQQLVAVGLAEIFPRSYLQFDPALCPALLSDMSEKEREAALDAWAQAILEEANVLVEMRFEDPAFAQTLALRELPNFLAALERVARTSDSQHVVAASADVEKLVSPLGRPRVLARVSRIREEAAGNLGEWERSRFLAESAAIDQLLERGLHSRARVAAEDLIKKAQAAGEAAYEEAAYDLATAYFRLGRALLRSGAATLALAKLEEAHARFQRTGLALMSGVVLNEMADCLADLGRVEEAAAVYEEAVKRAEEISDHKNIAVIKGQLATIRLRQRRYGDALKGHEDARTIFEGLGEPRAVATAWHNIGMVHRMGGRLEAAEDAFQKSIKIKMQVGDDAGEAATVGELGTLYSEMGRTEEAVRFRRQAADFYNVSKDLAKECRVRNNAADDLIKLGRYEEARQELFRAIECGGTFGHTVEPWKTFNILDRLEGAAGNAVAQTEARQKALEAYSAYRRDGGEPQYLGGHLCAAIVNGQAPQIAAQIQRLLYPMREALQRILAGSCDITLADDPNLFFADAVELRLLLERLGPV